MLQEIEIFCNGLNKLSLHPFLCFGGIFSFLNACFNSNNSEFQWVFGVFIDIIEDNIGSEFFHTSN